MGEIRNLFQTADWKVEKHVPVISLTDAVHKNEPVRLTVSVGKEIPHPNTTEHHIRWIQLFFKPEGDKFSYQIGNFEFTAHGESVDGPNAGPIYTHHSVTAGINITKPGTIIATSLCNIHGLWENAKEIKLK
ncbi:MAG: class II SORL domain-containing protein [Candidatus Heimdallarchaeota archaeon]|nr:class II SORL domain-containing protein [Candidatus Heimdallarchaeota archaeon]